MSRVPASKCANLPSFFGHVQFSLIDLNSYAVLNPTEQDLQMLLAAQCHIGTKNVTSRMTPYVYKRRADGNKI